MVVIHIVLWSYGIQRQATRHESSILPWPPGVMRYCISSVHLADSLGFLSPPREKAHPKQQTGITLVLHDRIFPGIRVAGL